ncbi:MAG TPA: DNA polymerase III subunit alpha [Candidatus Kapabacteria bacterium]|nr:DNA polymerase III subunit alpha [Candidatus Kapabacteria bacterium]
MFAHLHARSWFSFLAGGSSPEELAAAAAAHGMEALALTDTNGVYGAVRFQQACRRHGIRPIVGAEVGVVADAPVGNGRSPLVLLARTQQGYANLCRILTQAHLASRGEPALSLADIAEHRDGLVCLSGGRDGLLYRLAMERKEGAARRWLAMLRDVFGEHLYAELVHYARPGDGALMTKLYDLAVPLGIGLVATGDVRHARREQYIRYDLASCIRLGITVYQPHPERPVNGELYMKDEQQMRRHIPFPEAFENAAAIAASCSVDLLPGAIVSPGARLPDGVLPFTLLHDRCIAAVPHRYDTSRREQAMKQLANELSVVGALGLEEFFLVVSEVTDEARRRGIRCAGRGSAANSIIAYLLGITGVDPLEHHLLFERFLHGGRKSTPDIDIDFDSERRSEVIAWMEERFGTEQTAMTATVITYGLRMALRDVAKVLGWPNEVLSDLTSTVPSSSPRAVRSYRENIVAVLGESPLIDLLMEMTESLEGCPRHLSLHSGGMILSRSPLHNYTPIQVSANGVKEVQFDKNDVEALGLIKLDVLGLRMLAAVSEALELIERSTGQRIDIDELSLNDPATFELIRSGRTLGTFQIESQGQMHLLAMHQPETFGDLIAEIALFRPGPLQGGMVRPFINRRRGIELVAYDDPLLEPLLKDTYGVILYQEQVLEVAHQFAGMSLAEADSFRSLMSRFRSAAEMEGMRGRFVCGAIERGVTEERANYVFDKISNFVGYGFCRSHAAAFAKTVYQSCWLKEHHPAAFMAAIMQQRPGMYSLNTLEEEARRFGVPVLLPEINRSGMRYELEQADGVWCIRKPLAAITELSGDDARTIVLERLNGAFASVEDLYARVALPRDTWDMLARSGALDTLAGSSRRALWMIGVLARRLGASGRRRAPMLFEMPALEEGDIPALPILGQRERLQWDFIAQSSARRHPMTLVRRLLTSLEVRPVATCYAFTASGLRPPSAPHPVLTIAGTVILRQMPPTANGVMFVTLEDESGMIQCIVYPALRERLGLALTRSALVARGELQIMGNWRGLVLLDAWVLDGMLGGYEGYPSAYGGTDRLIIEDAQSPEESLAEYQAELFNVEEVREAMKAGEPVLPGRRNRGRAHVA